MGAMETRDAVLSFRVTASLKAELQRRADASRRKLADYVTLILENHVEDTPDPKPAKSKKS